jgi:hypothetical protein
MKTLQDFVNEALTVVNEQKHNIDDIYAAVDEWFWDVNIDGYDTTRQKRENYEAMVELANDPMVDACIDSISNKYPNAEDFIEEIEKHLADLCAGELEDL